MKINLIPLLMLFLTAAPAAFGQKEWRIINSGISGNLTKVAFDGNFFYATDGDVHRSSDGVSWFDYLASGNYDPVVSITICEGGALLIGSSGYWAPGKKYQHLPGDGTNLLDSAYLNGVVIVTGLNEFNEWVTGRYLDSDRAVKPIQTPWDGASGWVIATDKEFLVLAGGGIYASEDGASWTLRSRKLVSKPFWHNGVLYSRAEISSDAGKTWSDYSHWIVPDAFGAGNFIRRENGGLVSISSDGLIWNPQETGATTGLNGITFGKNTFVAVGFNGRVLISNASEPPPPTPIPQLSISPAVTLKWLSASGSLYQPESSSNLKTWAPFGGPIPGTGSEITRSFEVADQRKYFRVTVR